ncbi:MAG: hypothetical protein AAGF26_14205 [Cyanobacteria bacterium P01_G01_bin.49]
MKINQTNHNPGLCRWCVYPRRGEYVVTRQDCLYRWVSDYACQQCADGWREIADEHNNLVV